MIDLKDLRDNPDKYRDAARKKRIDVDIDRLLALESERRQLDAQRQQLTAEKNAIGKQIGQLAGQLKKASGDEQAKLQEEMKKLQARPTEIKAVESGLDAKVAELSPQIDEILYRVPQPADSDVPVGKDDSENVEVKKWGTIRQFEFTPKSHIELGEKLGIVDFERGVKLAGSRSYFLLGDGALLHQAVLRLAQDMMIERGFVPMSVPVLVREDAMLGTGYFPLGREQAYAMSNEDPPKFLVGSAEVPLTAYHSDETLDAKALPKKYVALSPCFRREAGTYGKDTAGLYRIHQFDKVEQVVICRNDVAESKKWHEAILKNAEDVLQKLNLPYRVVFVCTGDLGQGQIAKYDIETWMPSRNSWGETHSASRFYDFQARRLNLRYRDDDGKVKYAHTLNNTVIASPRVLIPIMELYQNADGTITIPEALRPYMNGRERITGGGAGGSAGGRERVIDGLANSAPPAEQATTPPLPQPSLSLPFRPIVAPLIAHRGSAAAIGLASAAQIIVTILHVPGMQCPFIRLTGVPCPGCGLSRACAAMVTGDPEHSFRMHAFALPVLIGVAILLIAAALPAATRVKMSDAFARLERTTGITFLLLMGLMVYWVARLLYAPRAFMSLVGQH